VRPPDILPENLPRRKISEMRIGIDGGSWSNRRGYGRFLREIVNAIAALQCEHRFVMFLDHAAAADFTPLPRFEIREVALSRQISDAATSAGNRSPRDLLRMGRAVAKEPLDVFFFPTVYSYFPLWNRVPVVLGVHDTIAGRNPQFAFAGKRQELFWRAKVRAALFQSRLVMTVSDYSRNCLREFHNVPDRKIRVVHEAASSMFSIPVPGTPREPFILYAGGISPNKNIGALIRAFSKLGVPGWRLVLAGDYQSDGFRSCYGELSSLVNELGLHGRVEFPGYVSDTELVRLYQRAGLFVLPSFDEGFGLPAIEAMACGAPVIVGEGNALTEVVGEAGIAFAPRDHEALARQMTRVITDPDLWLRMSESGVRRAASFSWDSAARTLIRVLEEAGRS